LFSSRSNHPDSDGGNCATGVATPQFAFSERMAVQTLPPSIQTSVQKAISNGAFFLHQNAVLLPPPAGLFSNWSAPAASVNRMGEFFGAQLCPASQLPLLRNSNQHVPEGFNYIDSHRLSSTAQRRVREGADSDGSDDNQSQCSTASYDGSQRSKSNVENQKNLHGRPEESHPASNVGGSSNSDALSDEKRDVQDIKKRTWKVLLTPEQACEVNIRSICHVFGATIIMVRQRF
jgi:hypothetical protein